LFFQKTLDPVLKKLGSQFWFCYFKKPKPQFQFQSSKNRFPFDSKNQTQFQFGFYYLELEPEPAVITLQTRYLPSTDNNPNSKSSLLMRGM
jgi:hypothetical protein